jgi:hypothetical protein
VGWALSGSSVRNQAWSQVRWAAVALLVLDLVVANAWLLPGVAARPVVTTSAPRHKLPVFWGQAKVPESWREQSSLERLEEVVTWELDESFPRLHWINRARMLNAPATIEPLGWREFLNRLEQQSAIEQKDGMREQARLSWQTLFDSEKVWFLEDSPEPENLRREQSRGASSGAAQPESPDDVFFVDGQEVAGLKAQVVGQVIARTEQTVTVRVALQKSGTIFLAEGYLPGWRIEGVNSINGSQVGGVCVCVAGWLRGFRLEPGDYQLTFSYTPHNFFVGLYVSLICWLGTAIYWMVSPAKQ